MSLWFEWDTTKAEANLSKHGISFDEAMSVFADSISLTVPDSLHSVGEERSDTRIETAWSLSSTRKFEIGFE